MVNSLATLQSLGSSLGATDLYDYTGRVLDLVSSSVQEGRDTQQCCDYPYQMLDKFCASRTFVRTDAYTSAWFYKLGMVLA